MSSITLNNTVGDTVASDYRTAEVFNQFGIDFCLGGGQTIKDVCDKIIHADSLDRVFEKTGDDGRKPITSISGTYKRKPWVLEISVDLFCASVLNWVDELEQA